MEHKGRSKKQKLTPHQIASYLAIKHLTERGHTPTLTDIAKAQGRLSDRVKPNINRLVHLGYIKAVPIQGKSRGLLYSCTNQAFDVEDALTAQQKKTAHTILEENNLPHDAHLYRGRRYDDADVSREKLGRYVPARQLRYSPCGSSLGGV